MLRYVSLLLTTALVTGKRGGGSNHNSYYDPEYPDQHNIQVEQDKWAHHSTEKFGADKDGTDRKQATEGESNSHVEYGNVKYTPNSRQSYAGYSGGSYRSTPSKPMTRGDKQLLAYLACFALGLVAVWTFTANVNREKKRKE